MKKEKSKSNLCAKKLEDYEQMPQYYTLMRTKSKMKDYDVEWWDAIE